MDIMGSTGSSRKQTDAPKIEPRKTKGAGNGGDGGGAGGQPEKQKNEYCPLSFKVDLPSKPVLVVGAELRLKQEEASLVVMYRGIKVGELKPQLSQRILKCQAQGYRYPGTVQAVTGEGQYGEFKRTS